MPVLWALGPARKFIVKVYKWLINVFQSCQIYCYYFPMDWCCAYQMSCKPGVQIDSCVPKTSSQNWLFLVGKILVGLVQVFYTILEPPNAHRMQHPKSALINVRIYPTLIPWRVPIGRGAVTRQDTYQTNNHTHEKTTHRPPKFHGILT